MFARNSNASAASAPSEFRGTHVFNVTTYGKHRRLGAGIFIPSETFHIGSYAWSIRFYPGGHASEKYLSPDYVAVTLELMSKDVMVTVSYDMGLVDQATGACYFPIESEKAEFDTNPSW
ncbi:hypothetical protein PR202_gb25566 [Eleusine coracana subsp. coracana]|uniref:MATH domain-containing protein n=1 Tax=Eleusine coracana subsp. coracana TaxID=191504 RepID=A0AAV5FPK7_ELECO|nr:hypothetical protein PR202_gb25566 [Eleusine coracana subsp. coracana]